MVYGRSRRCRNIDVKTLEKVCGERKGVWMSDMHTPFLTSSRRPCPETKRPRCMLQWQGSPTGKRTGRTHGVKWVFRHLLETCMDCTGSYPHDGSIQHQEPSTALLANLNTGPYLCIVYWIEVNYNKFNPHQSHPASKGRIRLHYVCSVYGVEVN